MIGISRGKLTVLAGVVVSLVVGAAELQAQAYLVKDINPGSRDGTDLLEQAHAADGALAVGGTLFFAADDGLHGMELWKTNGTEAGTVLVSDVNPGPDGSVPRALARVGSVVFFSAEDAVHGRELWRSDGTAAGTVLMKDIIPGPTSSLELPYSGVATLDAPAVMGNSLFFVARDGAHGATLWKSDGTAAGTVLVKVVGPFANIRYLLPFAGILYFSANTDQGSLGNGGLWRSDGTGAGTTLVKGFPQDQPFYLTAFNGLVYFGMVSDIPMGGLWKSDGTTDGTVPVWVGGGMSSGGTAPLQVVNGRLFFSANNEPHVSDGTTAGTKLLKDISPTINASVGSATTFVGLFGNTFFAADDQVIHGSELWKTDGTAAGTVLVKDIYPGQPHGLIGLSAKTLTCASGALYFLAKDQQDNFELWKSDGTEGGTVLLQDFNPDTGSWATPIARVGNLLYVEADDGTTGRELWALDVGDDVSRTRADFGGDGKSDILWRHSGGALYLWQMNGATLTASSYVPPISTAWQVKAIGDFGGDGRSDILWRENTSGATYLWTMNGAMVTAAAYTASQADNSWTIQGLGDFGGDGKADVLWRHSGGALYVWQMNGTAIATSSYLPPISLAWTINDLGDFDGDGKTDILWRESASGSTYIWLMNGAATIGSGYTAAQADNSWTIQGVGDFDADGRSDILWRHGGGALYFWLMNGTGIAGSTYLPPISTAWQIRQLSDFNGDGRTDILWRESASGSAYLWLMNGASAISTGYTASQADNSWTIQKP